MICPGTAKSSSNTGDIYSGIRPLRTRLFTSIGQVSKMALSCQVTPVRVVGMKNHLSAVMLQNGSWNVHLRLVAEKLGYQPPLPGSIIKVHKNDLLPGTESQPGVNKWNRK